MKCIYFNFYSKGSQFTLEIHQFNEDYTRTRKRCVCGGGNNPSQRVNKYGWMFKELTEKVGKEKYENLVHNEKQAQCIESGQLLNLYGHCYFSCQKWNINLNIFSQRPTKTNTSSHWMKMINDIHIIYFMLWALL